MSELNKGDLVKYWKGIKSGDASGEGKIKAFGEVCGSDVVWIEGCSACVATSHIEKIAS